MKNTLTILFVLTCFTLSSQNIINQLGGNDATAKFYINNSDGDSIFVIRADGGMLAKTSLRLPIKLITADYTAEIGDYTILCDASNSDILISFSAAVSGTIINVKRVDTQNNRNVTISDNMGNTYVLTRAEEGVTLQYFVDPAENYTGWWPIAGIN
jgi:hypothetical protein